MKNKTDFLKISNAQIYYEFAGSDQPIVFIPAVIADSRQWDKEFAALAKDHAVLRYDPRGHGKSLPTEGDYNALDDLAALLDHVGWTGPVTLVGCSMGGGLALDFALTHPERVRALVLVSAAPSGLWLDVELNPLEEDADKAMQAGDLDQVAELYMQMFYDGMGREKAATNPPARVLAYQMCRLMLEHASKGLGNLLPNTDLRAPDLLGRIAMPVLAVNGEFDEPFIHAAAAYMAERIPNFELVTLPDAAHMVNMEQPEAFLQALQDFLAKIN